MKKTTTKRAICVKCGRKRKVENLKSAYWNNSKMMYNSKWRNWPRRDSWICKVKCLNYRD